MAKKNTPVKQETKLEKLIDDKFELLRKDLEGLTPSKNRLLTIPIFGWTGDGKTCSILSMLHHGDAVSYGLALALADSIDELEKVTNSSEKFQKLDLIEIAKSTSERLSRLQRKFVNDSRWPEGTDAPESYLLRIRGPLRTYGYTYIPDLKGGSFQNLDNTARSVLKDADACIIMVDPARYTEKTNEGKNYKDAIESRIQLCFEEKLVTAVMISKSDIYSINNEIEQSNADITFNRLKMIISNNEDIVQIFRVSVIGDPLIFDKESFLEGAFTSPKDGIPKETLPSIEKRNPIQLVYAWCWLLTNALKTPENLDKKIPTIRLHSIAQALPKTIKTQPEIRKIWEFSNPPGIVLCSLPSNTHLNRFLLLQPDGILLETTITEDKLKPPGTRPFGKLENWVDIEDLQAINFSSELFVGKRYSVDNIWYGRTGDIIIKVPLPFSLAAWTPIDIGRIAGIDKMGRISELRYKDKKWHQENYIPDFIPPSELMSCVFLKEQKCLIFMNGQEVQSILVDDNGFSTRVDFNSLFTYSNLLCEVGSTGMFLSVENDASIKVVVDTQSYKFDEVYHIAKGEVSTEKQNYLSNLKIRYWSIANLSNFFVYFDNNSKLRGVLIQKNQNSILEQHSITLNVPPTRMVWSENDEILLISSLENESWSAYTAIGWPI